MGLRWPVEYKDTKYTYLNSLNFSSPIITALLPRRKYNGTN